MGRPGVCQPQPLVSRRGIPPLFPSPLSGVCSIHSEIMRILPTSSEGSNVQTISLPGLILMFNIYLPDPFSMPGATVSAFHATTQFIRPNTI